MRKILFVLCLGASSLASAQLKSAPSGGSKKASVTEMIGITDVAITYHRPGVKGREGKIYGDLIHTGFADLGWGTSKASPWRAGANDNTVIEFSTDVKINDQPLPAGKYGFFIAYYPEESILIFSKNATSWGSAFYDKEEDALRIKVKPVLLEKSVEWLKFEFMEQTDNAATIALMWEKCMFPFHVEVDLVKTAMDNYKSSLRGRDGLFEWQPYQRAANLCVKNNTNLEEGLYWSSMAVMLGRNFVTLNTYATLLEMNGKKQTSDSIMRVAMDMASVTQLHYYGAQLLYEKKNEKALEIFKANAKKHPKQYLTAMDLAKAHSALGDHTTALGFAKNALPLASTAEDRKAAEEAIKVLKNGGSIN